MLTVTKMVAVGCLIIPADVVCEQEGRFQIGVISV